MQGLLHPLAPEQIVHDKLAKAIVDPPMTEEDIAVLLGLSSAACMCLIGLRFKRMTPASPVSSSTPAKPVSNDVAHVDVVVVAEVV